MKYNITPNDVYYFAYLWEFNNVSKIQLSKQLNISYPHLLNKTKTYENIGLVRITKGGRTSIVSLTEKGKPVSEHCNKLLLSFYGKDYQYIRGKKDDIF